MQEIKENDNENEEEFSDILIDNMVIKYDHDNLHTVLSSKV